ncbi:MAG TPA: TIGR01459 family HAD-type hydrolase [Sphingomicrobium sp.]|nr:TIGR01459 family HAD-type hydrolase [Sphingomicrobium sp.]
MSDDFPSRSASTFWDSLDPRYQLILCDIWGVVHDGTRLYPAVPERLAQWRAQGRFIVLITNAPRTADDVARQLRMLGLSADHWDAIVTSGEAGIAALAALGEPVGFLGTAADRAILEGRGLRIAEADFAHLACTGLDEWRAQVEQYADDLDRWAERGVVMHCLNPDRLVLRGGVAEACAGALADLYEAKGGEVRWFGKPYPPIYEHALALAGHRPADRVLAIGDGLRTDMLGAAAMGFDAVYVNSGVDSALGEREWPGDWRPLAEVAGFA